jgi:LemA protein
VSAGLGQALAAVAVAALLVAVVGTYNGLVRRRNEIRNAEAQVDAQLVRRHDLVPNLVAAVRGYQEHERATFERVARARAEAVAALGDSRAMAGAENELGRALAQLVGRVEAYPQLQASGNAARLQEDLVHTENRIAYARQHYNDAVLFYNNARGSFPMLIVAGLFRFRPEHYLELELPSASASAGR